MSATPIKDDGQKESTDHKEDGQKESTDHKQDGPDGPNEPPDRSTGPMLFIKCSILSTVDPENSEAVYAYQAGAVKVLETATLSNVRQAVRQSAGAKRLWNLEFASKSGAALEDSLRLKSYMELNNEKANSDKSVTLDVYMKKSRDDAPVDAAQTRLDKQIEASQKLREAIQHATGKELKQLDLDSLYDASMYKATKGEVDHAAEMTEKQWSVVIRNNALLCGHLVEAIPGATDEHPSIKGVKRAPFPAFALKQQMFQAYEQTDVKAQKPTDLYIPHWQQQDLSYISVTETSSALKESLTKSGFSDWDVSASGGGSAFGFSVSASVSVAGSKSDVSSTDTETKETKLTISYNFPRVRIIFDRDSICLTTACANDLNSINEKSTVCDLYRFEQKYGQFFSTDVLLGGRLHCTTDKSSIKVAAGEDQISTFKTAASVSFSTPIGAGGSAGAGYSTGNESHQQKATASSNLAILWEATGGNTLLANSPPDWCPSVGSFYNWRIVRQEGVLPLIDLIGQMKGYASKIGLIKDMLSKHITVNMEEERKRQEAEEKKSLGAIPFYFELVHTGLSGSASRDAGEKWTLIRTKGLTDKLREIAYFPHVAQHGIQWALANGFTDDATTIEKERVYFLQHGAQVEWLENIPHVFPDGTTKFFARTLDGKPAEILQHNTEYEIFDESDEWQIQVTQWTPNTLKYGYVNFVEKAARQRKTTVKFQTPGAPKATGTIHDSSQLEMVVKYDTPNYEGLYTESDTDWYNFAAIDWDWIKHLRASNTVNVHNFNIRKVDPTPSKPFGPPSQQAVNYVSSPHAASKKRKR